MIATFQYLGGWEIIILLMCGLGVMLPSAVIVIVVPAMNRRKKGPSDSQRLEPSRNAWQ